MPDHDWQRAQKRPGFIYGPFVCVSCGKVSGLRHQRSSCEPSMLPEQPLTRHLAVALALVERSVAKGDYKAALVAASDLQAFAEGLFEELRLKIKEQEAAAYERRARSADA